MPSREAAGADGHPSAFLDAAAGEPLHPIGLRAWQAAVADGWADPVKRYQAGRRATLLLEAARESVAEVIDARPDEVTFTSSGTTAAHAAVLGTLAGRSGAGTRLVHSAVEHQCVMAAGAWHDDRGGATSIVPVDRAGIVDLDQWADAVQRPDTAAASLMSVNHEVGVRQPLQEATVACAEAGVPLVVDAAQSLGKQHLEHGWSVLVGSAHKWGGPPGVGVLAVRTGTRWRPYGPTDSRERGRAPGTPNLPAIVAAAAALRAVAAEAPTTEPRLAALAGRLRDRIPQAIPDVVVHGDPRRSSGRIVSLSVLYVSGEALQQELDARGIAVSTGSSCVADRLGPSHVLEAMGVLTQGNLRFSLHRGTRPADVDLVLNVLPDVVARLRSDAGAADL